MQDQEAPWRAVVVAGEPENDVVANHVDCGDGSHGKVIKMGNQQSAGLVRVCVVYRDLAAADIERPSCPNGVANTVEIIGDASAVGP
jgi:hypothetical protein